ncbi:hypothetical protein F5148DRAFT_981701 [Russula earlei]|uniref:Uncharacterized protein n=1 Tax=Russula earlei TaxID=71964 RepID=A0ACC0U7G0_9AGAM|nr:hypothetical protein F5148DRAFT_981701 [Russula earlei]
MQQPTSRPASTSTRLGPSPRPYQVNTQTKVIDTVHGRILCIADIRGRLSSLNDLAREENAKAIIHTGDFGFFEATSVDRIHDRTLRHLTMYSPLIPSAQRHHLLSPENSAATIRQTVTISMLSEFPLLLASQIKLQVPVYTVAGACEDILVLEKLRTGTYDVENLHLIDEATTRCLDIGGIKLRLLGIGGAFVPHKMFDNGEGNATIAGGNGTIWTTALQIGELVDTAQRVFDPTETRLLITHASPGREGIIASLALVLKADLTISAGLHFRYACSWNEFSVQADYDDFRSKLRNGRDAFYRVWESVKSQVDAVIDENQRVLLHKALSVVDRVPLTIGQPAPGGGPPAAEDTAWKNCWNWNLCDAAYGSLVLDIKEGRVSAELRSQGFNYAYRRSATPTTQPTPTSTKPPLPPQITSITPIKAQTPAPAAEKATPQEADVPSRTHALPPTSEPASGKETPPATKVNGSDSTTSTPGSAEKEKDKGDREKSERNKPKRKDRKDRDHDRADKDATRDLDGEGSSGERKDDSVTMATAPPKPKLELTGSSAPGSDTGPVSPRTDSAGARTPTSRKQPRNPWTLFVRLPNPTSEPELREFFGEAKAGITRVNFPGPVSGRERKIAYVEFGDEVAMKAGLEKHAEKLNDGVPEVVRSDPRSSRDHGGYRGFRGRGRGGPGGGFAARGLSSAGLVRGGAPKTNGDT